MPGTESDGTEQPLPGLVGVLADLRRRCGLTQEELAERSGLTSRTISDLERGIVRRPRRDTVIRLAAALGLAGAEADQFVALARGHSVGPAGPVDGVRPRAVAPQPRDLVRAFDPEGRAAEDGSSTRDPCPPEASGAVASFPWLPDPDGTPAASRLTGTTVGLARLAVELAGAVLKVVSGSAGHEAATAAVRRAMAEFESARAEGRPEPERDVS